MRTIIAANDSALANQLSTALSALKNHDAPPQVLSHDSANQVLLADEHDLLTVVFFCSQTFSPSEIALLKELHLSRPGKVKVVAVGPLQSPESILKVIRSGAVDYLDSRKLSDSLAGLLERLIAEQRATTKAGKVFTVLGVGGGSGASLLASNIAATLVQRGKACGLLDLHLHGGDLAKLLNAAPRYTLGSLVDKAAQFDATMFEQSLFEHESGIRLLAGPEPFTDFRHLVPEVIQKLLHFAQASFPYAVVDLEEVGPPEQSLVLAASDRVLVVLRPDYVSLFHAKKCLEYLGRANVAQDRVTLVVNRTGQPRELPLATLSNALEMPIRHGLPNNPMVVNTSYNLGIPLTISRPKGAIARSIGRVVDELTGEGRTAERKSTWLTPFLAPARWFGARHSTETSASELQLATSSEGHLKT